MEQQKEVINLIFQNNTQTELLGLDSVIVQEMIADG